MGQVNQKKLDTTKRHKEVRKARLEREAVKNAKTFMSRGRIGRRIASGKRK